ncbi:MAG: CoA transferase [Chloroflexi bacterium]|nr:CoA transferase [Chloroflexota bacterium]
MEQVLSDIKVLDLTHYVAGPYCTRLLADYGAEVIKIEKPGEGDGARRMGPFLKDDPHPEKSGLFLHLNTNKKGVTLNLKTQAGVGIFKELVKDADIVVENFEPRVMSSLGLDYETLEKINPRLVMTSISNFGQTGPYRDYKATELTIFAMGTLMITEGEPDREPLKFPGYKAQYLAGTYGAAVTMGALFGSKFAGIGQHVDISILECMLRSGEGSGRLIGYAFGQDEGKRVGHRREGAYLSGVYPCKDGYVSLLSGGLPYWPRVVAWMGMPELLNDPRFADPKLRPLHHGDFDAIFIPWLMEQTVKEAFQSGQKHGIIIVPDYTIDQAVKDPQLNARGFFTEIEHPVVGKITHPGLPFTLPAVLAQPQRPAPLLGQHNQEVLVGRLGYTVDDLTRLRRQGAI